MTDRHMNTSTIFDRYMERIEAGDRVSAEELQELATTPDILPLGMLADTARRRRHGARTTFLRVATYPLDAAFVEAVPPQAKEIRITGSPQDLSQALGVLDRVQRAGAGRTISAFSWTDVERVAGGAQKPMHEALSALRGAGLDAFVELPLDRMGDIDGAIDSLAAAGFERLRLTIDTIAADERAALFFRAQQVQRRLGCIHAINPLPMTLATFRPTTGYEDVKTVAIARLAAADVPTIQVDWLRYGPKLAQVALTFGADDIDGISPSDDAPEGRRRAPLEEVRRNIEAAGYTPVERDGRFAA
jgi:aminodeoxyfutalosine synthase